MTIKPQRLAPVCGGAARTVSIIIKALNEEKHIEATIQSALRAAAAVDGEVVLADSGSTDRTAELAMRYPVRVVQLADADERCCGIGPQLGYQHCSGEFVYIMDGDMQLLDGFLEQALAFLRSNKRAAGVGGLVIELNTISMEYAARIARRAAHLAPGRVDRLDGGGLYRRSAVEATGYLSDRNLHSYEEFDLAIRLRALSWQLWRIPAPAVNHHGHDEAPYQLLLRRWRSRYAWGLGELVRAVAGRRQLRMVWAGLRELRLYSAVLVGWLALASVPFWMVPVAWRIVIFCALAAAPVLLMTWRKRSAAKALYSVASWCVNAAGLAAGMLRARRPPREPISSRILRDGVATAPPTPRQTRVTVDSGGTLP